MATNCDETKKEVQQWLKKIFSPSEVPKFEESDSIYGSLMKLQSINLVAEENAKAKIDLKKDLTRLYNKKSYIISSCMMGSEVLLSRETIEAVESLASVAQQLDLKEPTVSNFSKAATVIETIKKKKSEESIIRSHHLCELSDKVVATIDNNISLERELKYLEDVLESQKSLKEGRNIERIEKGLKNDALKSEICEKELAEARFNPSIHHHNLVEKNVKNLELKAEVQDLIARLQKFKNLPPNINLAKERIGQVTQAIAVKEQELQVLIDEIE